MIASFRRFLSRHPHTWVAFILWLASLMMILTKNSIVNQNVASIINGTFSYLIYPFHLIPRTFEIWKENQRLRSELMATKSKLTWLTEAEFQLPLLKSFLEFDTSQNWKTIPAEVIGRYFRIGHRRIVINRGLHHGVQPPLPVINEKGVVGRILYSTLTTSEVQIIGDPDLGIAVKNQRSRVEGILRTSKSDLPKVEGVPLTADVKNGDLWITAGVGKIYPKGIPVAKQLPLPSPSGHFLNLPVVPTANIEALEFVFVLTSENKQYFGDGDQ
ncbi:MAG: rod shape-determining protein MreC [bacterium]|nr:rod shape-determining protein MreC [bacterium]